MARVLRREIFSVSRSDVFRIIPLGDIHIGARASDEEALAHVCKMIADDDRCFFIGMGDYCNFINTKDPRYSSDELARWITLDHLTDIIAAEKERLMMYLKPIARKCLGLVEGNHERAIKQHFERDIYSEIVNEVKVAGGFDKDYRMAVGYYGWMRMVFYSSDEGKTREGGSTIKFNLHHGFGGGKQAGSKALDMQKWLWVHDCDVAILGHCHVNMGQPEAIETIDDADRIITKVRKGCRSGTFLKTVDDTGGTTYSEVKGYYPLPIDYSEVCLKPRAKYYGDRIRVIT